MSSSGSCVLCVRCCIGTCWVGVCGTGLGAFTCREAGGTADGLNSSGGSLLCVQRVRCVWVVFMALPGLALAECYAEGVPPVQRQPAPCPFWAHVGRHLWLASSELPVEGLRLWGLSWLSCSSCSQVMPQHMAAVGMDSSSAHVALGCSTCHTWLCCH